MSAIHGKRGGPHGMQHCCMVRLGWEAPSVSFLYKQSDAYAAAGAYRQNHLCHPRHDGKHNLVTKVQATGNSFKAPIKTKSGQCFAQCQPLHQHQCPISSLHQSLAWRNLMRGSIWQPVHGCHSILHAGWQSAYIFPEPRAIEELFSAHVTRMNRFRLRKDRAYQQPNTCW